jgi:aspartyl-tRNA(Asn)/glutamyl-tRNA(Gln) amidotransferase subunit A
VSALTETVRDCFERAKSVDDLNILLHRDEKSALHQARELELRDAAPGAMHGIPVVLKDNIATLGLPTSCGSRILENYVSPFEATATRRLREAGAIIIGTSNMDEYAMGSSTENSAFGPTRNPLARDRVPKRAAPFVSPRRFAASSV